MLIKQQWGTHFVVLGGREKQHRWRADNQKVGGRRTREKTAKKKEDSQKKRPQLLGKSEGPSRGIGDHHHTTRRNRPHGLWSRPCGERGGIKELKKTAYAPVLRLTRPLTKRACPLRLVYGAGRVCLGSTKAHTPSVQLTLVLTSTGPDPGS